MMGREGKDIHDFSLLFWKISISLALVSLFGFCRPHRQTEWTQRDSWRFLTSSLVSWWLRGRWDILPAGHWTLHCPAVQTLDQAPQSFCLHCVVSLQCNREEKSNKGKHTNTSTSNTTYLVPQNLLLADPTESLNVSNDDCHDQIYHDDGPEEDDADQ